tara:strand:+ start:468 stop:4154 length:3687 start_codon:yes stop_codon:yes gene_type:complete
MTVLNFSNKPGRSFLSGAKPMSKPLTDMSENLAAGFSFALQPINEKMVERDWWGNVNDEIQKQTGKEFANPLWDFNVHGGYENQVAKIQKYVRENQDNLRLGHPDEPSGTNLLLMDADSFKVNMAQLVKDQSLREVADADDVYERAESNTARAAYFLGALGSGMADPVNVGVSLALAPFSGGTSLANIVFREAIINMSAEVLQTPAVAAWYKTLGLDYGIEEFALNVAAAGAIGGAFPIVIRGGAGAVQLTYEQMKKGSEVIFQSGGVKTDLAKTAELELDVIETQAADNPLVATPQGQLEHKKREAAGIIAAETLEPPAITELPAAPVKAPVTINDSDNLDEFVFKFKPGEIQVDAKLFQFKEGGDEFGVTPELQGITEWDPSLAGQIAVYEFADGSQFIADGHQRLGLAKRIMAKDPSQDITIYGTKIRQVDGVTPQEAMVRAAMANIVNGKGTIFDAVKIARIAPEKFDSPSVKQSAAFVRRAKELVRLSDEAYGLALNGIVPDNYAAIVGRLVDDPDIQLAAMNVLARVKPGNEFQAETIIRQVMDIGVTKEKQTNLFGDEVIAESLILERAKVLDAAVTRLKKDKTAFAQVTKNQARLEDEGNQLATEANKKRLIEDGQAIQILQTQANRKGTLSDELTEAARYAKTSGKYGEAADSFVESVRRSIDSGDFLGTDDGNVGRALDDQAQDSAAPNETELIDLDKFDDAFGDAAENQGNAIVEDIRAYTTPERDMFDTGDNIQPGDRQVDLEELIANKVDDEQAEMAEAIRTVKEKIEPDWRPYMVLEEGDVLVPIGDIRTSKVRPDGVVNSVKFMVRGAKGEIPKRGSLLLRADEDGGFTVRDGNSTYTIAQAAGWSEMPSKIITDAQYATELSRKAADRILNQDALGKKKLRYVSGEDLGENETDIFVKALKGRQTFTNADEVLAAAVPNHDALNLAAKQAADDLGIKFNEAPVKTIDGINKKAKKYNGKYGKVADAARTGINAASMKEADDFIAAMGEKFHLLDEGWNVTPDGYFDRKLMVIFDDKSLGEIQIWPPGMLKAKSEKTLHPKTGHEYYKIAYDPKTTPDVAADAKQKMAEIYGAVTSKLDSSFATKLGIGAPRAKSADSTFSGGSSTDPSSVSTARASSSEPPTGSQVSSQIIPTDPSIAANSPKSNLKNLTATDDDLLSTVNIDEIRANINQDEDLFPVGLLDGEAQTVTARQLLADIDREDAMVDTLSRCPI